MHLWMIRGAKSCQAQYFVKARLFCLAVETCIKESNFFLGSLNRFFIKWLLF